MLILIAESKTMRDEREVSSEEYSLHRPQLETQADRIMNLFSGMQVEEIAGMTGLSQSLANRLYQYAYEFPNKQMGNSAIEAFSGVVFKALEYSSLSSQAQKLCEGEVRIVSSLYGWLRPDDIIKNYRLDYKSRLPRNESEEVAGTVFWRKDVTIRLVNELKETGNSEILNLMPGDASAYIDWKLVKNFAKVWKCDFNDAVTGKTPAAGKLKEMRGLLLRQILSETVERCEEIKQLTSDDYFCEGTTKYPDHLQFLC